jgi:eukaryotic-like serine/threonine-protein kinase
VTTAGQFLGSLPWASPEQTEGLPDRIGLQSDVYSLGVILYQIVSDDFPYDISGALVDVMNNIRSEPPRPLRAIGRRVSRDLETIARKALEKDPQRRYFSAADLARDVERCLHGEPISARTSTWYVLGKYLARHRVAVAVGALVLASLIGSTLIWAWSQWQVAHSSVQLADAERAVTAFSLLGYKDPLENPFLPNWSNPSEAPSEAEVDRVATALVHVSPLDNPEVEVTARWLLGLAYVRYERSHDALRYARSAYELARKALPDARWLQARTAHVLGDALFHAGRLREAADRYREASSLQKPDTAPHADSLNGLAACIRRLGDLRGAEELYRQVLAIRSRILPDDDPFVAASINNLAKSLVEQGRFEEAEAHFSNVLQWPGEIPGRFRIRTLLSLAECRRGLGDVEAALAYVHEAMTVEGGGDRERSACLVELGYCAWLIQSFDEARGSFEEALEIQRAYLGAGPHVDVADTLAHLGMALIDLDHLADAEAVLDEASAIYGSELDERHPDVARARYQRARLRFLQGRVDEAGRLCRQALEAQRARLDEDHPDLRESEALLAQITN